MDDCGVSWNDFEAWQRSGGMDPEAELSSHARARMHAMLPGLLGEVRARRRRRVARRAVVAAVVLVAPFALWRPWAAAPTTPARAVPVAASTWRTIHDDESILARCTVAVPVRAAWFADDAALRAALRAAHRPDGVVVTPGRVSVAAAAIDAFPGESP